MTDAGRRQEERRLDDERCVDGLLAEAGLPDDAELRALLLEMRNQRVTEVPEPSPELAALLGQPNTAEVIRLADRPRKQPGKGRIVFTTLAVAASLGVAGGAAAANDGLRSQAEGTISSIIGSFFHPAPAKPAPVSPAPTSPASAPEPKPARTPEPARAVVLPSPVSVPSVPAAVPAPRAEPSVVHQSEDARPRHGRRPQDDVESGRSAGMTQTGGKPADTGASRHADAPRYGHDRSAFERREFDRRAYERQAYERQAYERQAYERPARGAETSGPRNAQGHGRHGGGAGQDAGHPRTAHGQGGGRR
ncbi:hypothetical protein [Arthrobacter sp. NPDC056727]|uniref:hypothetical protein n=1 Tax=Arthrobacter sp. NPDC056727 TaxID=3345927 RepID=UPI00366A7EA0